jgi:hypothetical protein
MQALPRFKNATPSMKLALITAKALVAAFSSLLILACIGAIGIFIFLDHKAAEYTSGGDPVQFYRLADDGLLEDYKNVLGAAHNSGNSQAATREALTHGADIIEIDVVYFRGQLYAAHHSPLRYIGSRFFRGPRLSGVWDTSVQSNVIMLDLKNTRPEALEYFEDSMPRVIRLYSVPNEGTLNGLLHDDHLMTMLDGVTVKHTALSPASAALLKGSGKLIFAWTVNDLERVNELVEQDVDGIITDNLAILELLGNPQRGEVTLRNRISQDSP